MEVVVRPMVLSMFVWLMLAGICLGKEVYLKDGGVIEAQSAWQRGERVFVMVNRDIIADFNRDEIDLRRTFPKNGTASRRPLRTTSAPAASVAREPLAASVERAPRAATPASKADAVPVAPAAAVAVSSTSPESAAVPIPPAEPAGVPDKAELERRSKQTAEMMTQAIERKDSEMLKKALEMQKSAMAQQGGAASNNRGIPLYVPLMALVAGLLIIVAQWVIFVRAGVAGWKSLVPFYNMYLLMEISGKPGWWLFLLFVPVVGFVIYLLAMLSLAKKFNRAAFFGVGLCFLPMFFFPVLAFGGSEYEG